MSFLADLLPFSAKWCNLIFGRDNKELSKADKKPEINNRINNEKTSSFTSHPFCYSRILDTL